MTSEILSNLDIEAFCYEFDINLICCCSKDELIKYRPVSGCYVINLQNSSDGPGSHWVALYIFNNYAVFFDPFGQIYPYEIHKFINKKKLIYSDDIIQNINQQCCGYYCLDFLNFISKNYKDNPRKSLNCFLQLFNDDTNKNDNILQQHIKLMLQNKL